MKGVLIIAAVAALAAARPELYKEQEDFQFSRSSSDDGSKSGYYGAQRGNMGGNYERAHNMDSLAQHQMSGLVRQVDGELGDGANTRTGSVYSAANSRGIYGSGHYDLSNLGGRNFQEGTSYDSSQARSSLTHSSSAHNSAAYANSHSQSYGDSRYGAYQGAVSGTQAHADELQSLDNLQSSNQNGYGRHESHSSGYQSQSGFHKHSEYDGSNANLQSGYGSNVQSRLISATPVRIIITPGGRVAIPVAAHIPVAAQTYDATRGSAVYDQNSLTSHNSEAEVINDNNQGSVYTSSNPKHYESSYKYHKSWEKHDTVPTIVPVGTSIGTSAIPTNSELLEDSEAHTNQFNAAGVNAQSALSSSASGRYNAVKSTSSQSRYQANYNAQQQAADSNAYTQTGYNAGSSHGLSADSNAYTQTGYNAGSSHGLSADSLSAYNQAQYNRGSRYHGASSDSSSSAYNQARYNAGSHTDLNSQVEDLGAKPKSYQSSYSYHKSWEHQGDPYVIKPASSAYYDGQTSQRLTSGSASSHQASCCIDENGHLRIARSHNTDMEDMQQQQSQNIYEDQEVGQQEQNTWQNLEDLGQQSQNNWDQQSVGQQSQNQWDNLEILGQQSQSNWDQQSVGQESQNQWDNVVDLGQQSQKNWAPSEEIGQQSLDQHTWDQLGDNQQKENKNDSIESLGQQVENTQGQHKQDTESQLKYIPQDDGQYVQKENAWDVSKPDISQRENNDSHRYKIESPWDKFDAFQTNINQVSSQQDTSKNENVTGITWHQISNNEGRDQQISNTYKNNNDLHETYNQNVDNKPSWEQSSNSAGQTQDSVYSNNDNLSNQYSHNISFVNPSTYNNHNQFSTYQNNYHEEESSYSVHLQNHTHITWQDQATNTDSHRNLQDTVLSNFWNKFDNIEQQSGISKAMDNMNNFLAESSGTNHTRQDNTYQASTNFTSINSNQSKVTNKIEYDSKDYQNGPESEVQPVLPQTQQPLGRATNDINLPSKQFPSSEELETPEDAGRGDIGPDDISSKPSKPNNIFYTTPQNTEHKVISEYQTTQLIKNNNTKFNTFSDSQLAVSNTEQNRTKKDEHQLTAPTMINTPTNNQKPIDSNNSGIHKHYGTQSNYTENSDNQEYSKHNIQISQSNNNTVQQTHEIPVQYTPNSEQENAREQYLHNYNQENVQNFGQQTDNLSQQSLQNFNLENGHLYTQDNINLEQQNLHDFEHAHLQEFEQQNENQPSLLDFGQQNLPEFEQQNENKRQGNLQDFAQEVVNQNQQSLIDFGQQNLHDFSQQNENQGQETLHNFGQQQQNMGQQSENLEQLYEHVQDSENKNQGYPQDLGQVVSQNQQSLVDFGQQNIQEFDQENENQSQGNLKDLGQEIVNANQQSLIDFGQQNLQDFEQQNENQRQEGRQNPKQQEQQNMGQQSENLEQQFEHEQYFGQQNEDVQQQTQQFEQHNDHFEQVNYQNFRQEQKENLQDFGQQSVQDFGLQRENLHQQNMQHFGYQGSESSIPQGPSVHNTQQYSADNLHLQQPVHPDKIEEPIAVQKQDNNVQSNQPKSSENDKVETLVETATEKPGFWKSVGNKFSNAKDKVVSWFKS